VYIPFSLYASIPPYCPAVLLSSRALNSQPDTMPDVSRASQKCRRMIRRHRCRSAPPAPISTHVRAADDTLRYAVALALALSVVAFMRSGGAARASGGHGVLATGEAVGECSGGECGLVPELMSVAWRATYDAVKVLQRHAGKVAGSATSDMLLKFVEGLFVGHLAR
jgi:hypothetical protein